MVFHEPGFLFEERVVVVQATDFDSAQEKGKQEAMDYVDPLDNLRFIAIVDIFHIFEANLEDKAEVYSKVTKTTLNPDEYLKARYEDYDGEVVYRHLSIQ